MVHPYADSAWTYKHAGWDGPIPIGRRAAEKSPPPTGYTGWAGKDPSGADIQAWIETDGHKNIGLHLSLDQMVLDVDVYGEKDGAAELEVLEAELGPLPATWTNTARGVDSRSRQHFFRCTLPDGRVWKDHPVPGTESLHTGHRYAVVGPSVNPDAGGTRYLWFDPEGAPFDGIPRADDLTPLPEHWMLAFSQQGSALEGAAADAAETHATLDSFRKAPACPRVTHLLGRELDRLADSASGRSIHDAGKLHPLVCFGLEGHAGVREALTIHHDAYTAARVKERGETEGFASADWWRQVRGSVGKKLLLNGHVVLGGCDCDGSAPEADEQEQPAVQPDGVPVADKANQMINRMLSRDTLDLLPPVRPLIKGVLDMDSESWVIGMSEHFKSFVALDWAMHVGLGIDWRGCRTRQGVVVYVVAEGQKGIPNRVYAWEKANKRRMKDVYFLPEPVQAGNKYGMTENWRTLIEACRRIEPVMVVLDTQARMTIGLSENDNSEMSVFTAAVSALKQATRACVLVVHHIGRDGGNARGASSLDGAQDTEIRVERPTDKKGRITAEGRRSLTAVVSLDKNKDGSAAGTWPIKMTVEQVGVDEDGEPIKSLAVKPPENAFENVQGEAVPMPEEVADWRVNVSPNQEEVLKVLTEHSDSTGLTREQGRTWIREHREVRGVPDLPRTSYDSAVRDLVAKLLLTRLGAGRVAVTELLNMDL